MFELSIKVSNEEKRMTKKHPIHDISVTMDRDDPTLIRLVDEAVKEFVDEVDDVEVRTYMKW